MAKKAKGEKAKGGKKKVKETPAQKKAKKKALVKVKKGQVELAELDEQLAKINTDLDAAKKAADLAFDVEANAQAGDGGAGLSMEAQAAKRQAEWGLSEARKAKRVLEKVVVAKRKELEEHVKAAKTGKAVKKKKKGEKKDESMTQCDLALEEMNDERPVWSMPRSASKRMGGYNPPVITLDPRAFKMVSIEDREYQNDDDFVEIPKRQALFNMSTLQEMRLKARQMRLAQKLAAGDPQVFPREFIFKVTVSKCENMTNDPQTVFLAGTTAHWLARATPSEAFFFEDLYHYTDVIPMQPRMVAKLAKELEFYSQRVDGSYTFLRDIEFRLDCWTPSNFKLNPYLGVAAKRLYDMASGDTSQQMMITQPQYGNDPDRFEGDKAAENAEVDRPAEVMRIGMGTILQELFYFELTFSGLHFTPRNKRSFDDPARVRLRITAPTDMYGHTEMFTTERGSEGFTWDDGGTFVYEGTRASFHYEFCEIAIVDQPEGGGLFGLGGATALSRVKGAAIVPLAGTETIPNVKSIVKAVDFREKAYYMGVLAGFCSVKIRSKGLPFGVTEDLDDVNVPRPQQPLARSLILHLDPAMQYLVVELFSADGLAVGDPDANTSNPIVRVTFDGVTLETSVAERTTRPVWNQYLHFPVRYPNPAVRTDPALQAKVLPVDLIKRGNLEVEVWHHNGITTTELLGRCVVDPHLIMQYGLVKSRRVADPSAQARQTGGGGEGIGGESPDTSETEGSESSDEDDEGGLGEDDDAKRLSKSRTEQSGILSYGIHPDLVKEQKVRVYQARKETLTGGWQYTSAQSTITFDAYFIPDFAEDFVVPPQPEQMHKQAAAIEGRKKLIRKWDEFWDKFTAAYNFYFIDAIPPRCRRFLAGTQNSKGFAAASGRDTSEPLDDVLQEQDVMLLPSLIRHVVLPDGFRYQGYLMHWIGCIPFLINQKYHQTKRIQRWLPLDQVLHAKKGTVQDHCTLLCSILISLNMDAYVCKGTVRKANFDSEVPKYSEERLKIHRRVQYAEHCWVMTRETDGSVVFWETTQAITFHLKRRWTGKNDGTQWSYRSLPCNQELKSKWKNQQDDEKLADSASFWDLLTRRREALTRLKQLLKLPIKPMEEFGTQANIAIVPYYSIEIVFNRENVWGNLRNHDPAWVRYDLWDSQQWRPLLKMSGSDKWMVGSSGLSAAASGGASGGSLVVGPAFKKTDADLLLSRMQADVEEAVRFARLRLGLQTKLFRSVILGEALSEFLDNMEKQCLLDPAHATNAEGVEKTLRKGSNAWNGSLLTSAVAKERYRNQAIGQWKKWWNKFRDMDIRVAGVPIPENTTFEAIPFHFSTTDLREIRAYLASCKDAQRLLMHENEESEFVVQCNIYPLQHEMGSVWIFLGRLAPMTEAESVAASQATEKTQEAAKRAMTMRNELKEAVLRDLTSGNN